MLPELNCYMTDACALKSAYFYGHRHDCGLSGLIRAKRKRIADALFSALLSFLFYFDTKNTYIHSTAKRTKICFIWLWMCFIVILKYNIQSSLCSNHTSTHIHNTYYIRTKSRHKSQKSLTTKSLKFPVQVHDWWQQTQLSAFISLLIAKSLNTCTSIRYYC